MPRRDVVLTGLIAFGAGVAVGANWRKLRKQVGPMLEKLGLQVAELGDFLSASGLEEFVPEAMKAETKAPRPRARRRTKAKAAPTSEAFVPPAPRRNGVHPEFGTIRPSPKRKASRRKPVPAGKAEIPLAAKAFGE